MKTILALAAFAPFSLLSVLHAEVQSGKIWSLAKTEANTSNNTRYISLTNAYMWVSGNERSGADGEPLSPDKDYAIGGSALVYTFTNAATVFKGRSLRLGRVRHQSFGDHVTSWDNWGEGEGLIVGLTDDGYYTAYTGVKEARIFGKIRVVSTNENPFVFSSDTSFATMDYHCDFSGGREHAFSILGINSNSGSYPEGYTFKMSGSLTNYFGTVFTTNVRFEVNSTTLPGQLMVGNKTVLTTQSANDIFTVDTLSLGSGAGITVAASIDPADASSSTNGMIVVTNSLHVTDVVTVDIDESCWSGLTNAVSLPVLTVPSTESILLDMFVMNSANRTAFWGTRLNVVTNDIAKTLTLTAIVAPIVTNIVYKENGIRLDDPDVWSDGKTPHGDAHYRMVKIGSSRNDCITPLDLGATFKFPGKSFTVGNGCLFNQFYGKMVFEELRLDHGAIYIAGSDLRTGELAGRVVLPLGASDHASICAYNKTVFNISADIVGKSRIVIDGRHNSTGTRTATTSLTGDNSRFFGSITVGLNRDPMAIADGHFQKLVVSDSSKLGMSLPGFSPTALVLKRLAMLKADGDVEFSDTTRGIYIGEDGSNVGMQATATKGTGSEAQMYADEGDTLSVKTQLTLNGRLHKYGAGTLALGGPLRFGPAALISDESVAHSNYLAVAEGWIKPLAADSFNGMEISFAAGTGIRFDIDPADESLKAYGLRNTKSDVPFSAADGTFKVTFDMPEDFIPTGSVTVNLLTVSSDKVDAVRNMLEIVSPRILNYKTFLNVIPNGDVSTISATFKPVGLVFTVR